ncbi:hypothetical protein VPNG_08462 [Cytospora leucostoma]|uniref:DNA (cytosine-5)-methyltransferase 1 replication foci domain-containing protein n=1 Tax=Cytospora leucostoma TaxID=1230097 RepID=A0A423WRW0_9PEZI|nr:hypothetical protein VPNG_08462 [Cytospora leucostoma]
MAGGRPGRPPGRPRGSGRPRGPGRPPGRPRRYSNSTVASVDLAHISYLQETSVLKPTKITNSDHWPCIVLKEAVVYRKSKDGQLIIANVCNVDLEGPFVIRGQLDIELEQMDLRTYSIGYGLEGQDESPKWPVAWASGEAGWYEINPAPEYEAMYETVCEGITFYYTIFDAYHKEHNRLPKSKKHKAYQMPIEKLLFKYAVAVGDGVMLSEAQERCEKHAPFLLGHFEKEPDIDWGSTSFKRWMTASQRDLVRQLEEAKKKPPPPPPAHSLKSEEPPNDSLIDLPLRTSPETDRGRRSRSRASKASEEKDVPPAPHTKTPILPPALPPVRPTPAAASPLPQVGAITSATNQDAVQFLKDVLEEILAEAGGDPSKATESRVHSQMNLKCSIKAYRAAKEITHFYATPLVASLPSKWYESPFFKWLKSARDQPWKPEILTKDEVPGQCKRRIKMGKVMQRTRQSSISDILPPRAGKSWPPPSALTPRTGGLRPGPAAKRPAVFDDEETDDERARKAAKTKHELEEAEEEEEEDDDDEEEEEGDHELAPDLSTETVRVVVRSEKIPTMSPSGPNGTWKCEEPGCGYIVRSAEEDEGKDLIAKHFLEHSTRTDKLDLALQEGTRGHMPIKYAYFPPAYDLP